MVFFLFNFVAKKFYMKKIFLSLGMFFLAITLFSQNLKVIDGKVYSDNKLYTGDEISYFENSTQIMEAKHYVNGLEDGKSTLYYENGQIKAERFWKEGEKVGVWVNWNEAGNKVAEAGYSFNKKDGDWNIWNDKGQKLFEMHYLDGQKIGTWRQWDDNGNLIMEKTFD